MSSHADIRLSQSFQGPYHLKQTMGLAWMGHSDPAMQLRENTLAFAMRTPEGSGTLVAAQDARQIVMDFWGPGASWLADRSRSTLGLDDSADAFRPGMPLRDLWLRFQGMRLPRLPRIFDRLAQIVLLQKVTWIEAHRAWRRLASTWGEPAPGPLSLKIPPAPQQIARRGPAPLIGFGATPQQAETLVRLAGSADQLEAAAQTGPEALERALELHRGVGKWTTQYLLGSGLGHADAVLTGDYNLAHTVAWVLANEARGNDNQMLELLEPYRGNRFRVIRLLWSGGVEAPRRGPRHAPRSR